MYICTYTIILWCRSYLLITRKTDSIPSSSMCVCVCVWLFAISNYMPTKLTMFSHTTQNDKQVNHSWSWILQSVYSLFSLASLCRRNRHSMLILSDNLFVSLERNTNANETKMDKQTNIRFQVHGAIWSSKMCGTYAKYCRGFCFSHSIEMGIQFGGCLNNFFLLGKCHRIGCFIGVCGLR